MKIKVGQIYKGKMSGVKRRVARDLGDGRFLLVTDTQDIAGIYPSIWTEHELRKTCTLVEEEQ